MKNKLFRIPDITDEKLRNVAHDLRVSQNKVVLRAVNYYFDNEKYESAKEREKLSTGADLQEK